MPVDQHLLTQCFLFPPWVTYVKRKDEPNGNLDVTMYVCSSFSTLATAGTGSWIGWLTAAWRR